MQTEQLKTLCTTFGVSGEEAAIRAVLAKEIQCDTIETDTAGNLICTKKNTNAGAPTVLLDAHMDTIGLCIKEISTDGFLRFAPVGGIDDRILPGALVQSANGVQGLIATKPPHLMDNTDKKSAVSACDMWIDTGDNAAQLRVGDRLCYAPRFELLHNAVSATYLDNRLSCAAVLEVFARLAQVDLPFHLTAVFSGGEEAGMKGAAAASVAADMAIILDVTFGKTPDETSDEALKSGGGVAIGIGPNLHKSVANGLRVCAENQNIRHQTEVLTFSGTNAWVYQTAMLGIPCGMLSIPIKYMHTPVETVVSSDYEDTVSLLYHYLLQLTETDISDIAEVKRIC